MSEGLRGMSQREAEINSSVQFDPFTQGLKHNMNRELHIWECPETTGLHMIHEYYQSFGMQQ